MNLISIGTDRNIFIEGSKVRERMIEYGKMFEELHIIVFSTQKFQINSNNKIQNFKIGENTFVYTTNSRNKLFYAIDAFLILRKLIKNSRDGIVVSCQDPFETGIVGIFTKLIYGLPLQIQIHTDFLNKYFWRHNVLNKIRILIAHFVLPFADQVRVVSKKVALSIKDLNKNAEVLPINVQLENYKEGIFKTEKENKTNILTVCRLEREKDLETAIKAFDLVAKKYTDVIFTIVGDGSIKESLEFLVKSMNLENRIKFEGWKENTEEYYRKADIYFSTSLYEGYGVSMVEAGFFGLPLVISDTGVANDIFKDGESAFVCKQEDVECFADRLIKLISDEELRKKMGEEARNSTLKNILSREDYYTKYREIFNKIENYKVAKNFLCRLVDYIVKIFRSVMYVRYFICGITAAGFNIGILYIFTDVLNVWYLYSSIIAFVTALVLSFVLQKFVVFRDNGFQDIHKQFSLFTLVAVLGVITNTILVFVCTDLLGFWYIFSQLVAGFFVMIQNFLLYKFFIFKK